MLTLLSVGRRATQCLETLVITASHNPGSYLGLKVKGLFGSVPPEITQQIEALLAAVAEPSVANLEV